MLEIPEKSSYLRYIVDPTTLAEIRSAERPLSQELITQTSWPMAAFEHYMLADDRRDYAMTCHLRFWFKGHFDRPVFEDALRATLVRHPMMQATVEGSIVGPTRALRWVRVPGVKLPFISWKSEDEPIEEPPGGMRSDITKDIGIRLWLRESTTGTMLLFQFHHSVCDGAGLFAFMEDFLAAYGHRKGEAALPLRVIDPARLATRGMLGLTLKERIMRLGKDLVRTTKFFKVMPSPLLAPRKPGIGRTSIPDLQSVVRTELTEDETRELARQAKAAGATVNDVMMRELFVALDEWNRIQDPLGRRKWIRIAMPTDLRLPGDETLSAANLVSMVFLDRKGEQLDEPKALLEGIKEETRFIKDERMGITLIRVMRALGRVWGPLFLFMRAPLCSSTAVLTNLGRPFLRSPLAGEDGRIAVGGVVLEGLETLPPLRYRTRVAFSINSYGGPMRVTMRYDTTVYSPVDAREILGIYTRRLRRAAAAEAVRVPAGGMVPAPALT